MSLRSSLVVLVIAAAPLVAVAACAIDLDPHYVSSIAARDGDVPDGFVALPDGRVVEGGGGVYDGQPLDVVRTDGGPHEGGGCACDVALSQGCCLPPGALAPFCTASKEACGAGIFLTCEKPDPTTESVCCWNLASGGGSSTAYAATCGARPAACTSTADCANCKISTCSGVDVGACSEVAPVCP